jgi:hypothetical protein
MKKLFILLVVAFTTTCSFAQTKPAEKAKSKATKSSKWSFKAGLVSPLPVDVQLQSRIQLRSFLGEAACKISPKLDLTMHAGYLMFTYRTVESFENIVILPGVRYNANNNIYFGASAGPGFWSENIDDNTLLWSPYVGIKGGKISTDLRYFNWRKTDNTANTLGIVVSYNL